MEIKVIASTKVGYVMPKDEAVDFSGKSAGICYLPDTVETLFAEAPEKTQRRADGNIKSGHHSVFGHPTYNLCLEGIPKILAMILNNEKIYNTSEKSARYTHMEPSPQEKELYEKWIEIFKEQILTQYPKFEDKRALKLAQENARYLISVFTPATVMEYTVNFGQLNYIINWAKDYIKNAEENTFSIKLKETFKEFLAAMPDLEIEGLDSRNKNRNFSLFAKRKNRNEEFGENYSVTYLASFAQLAQAQRHRTLSYEMTLLDEPKYYVPPIIAGTNLEKEWLKDISSLKEFFPQGMLVQVNERGTIENFVLKCMERLCGFSQLEIMQETKNIMNKYLEATKDKPELYQYLLPYSRGARCTFPGWKCDSPCVFGGYGAMIRNI
ncbi:MAG: FAD-dependent thymidylate synthase [Clostridiales bacterium]|nr:FAD-dependent thymidylate synthase [Clostridiales bacterium]